MAGSERKERVQASLERDGMAHRMRPTTRASCPEANSSVWRWRSGRSSYLTARWLRRQTLSTRRAPRPWWEAASTVNRRPTRPSPHRSMKNQAYSAPTKQIPAHDKSPVLVRVRTRSTVS